MTAQRKRRGRQPVTILRELADARPPCWRLGACMYQHNPRSVECRLSIFDRVVRELRAALKGAKT